MKRLILLPCLLVVALATAQKPVRVIVHHKLGDAPFGLGQPAENNEGDPFMVTRLQYFMSEFTITHDGGQSTRLEDVYALVNAAEPTHVDLGVLNVNQVERIDFGIGVPSPENNADPALWPAGHPLAPSAPSMHWGWAGGYRFAAYEGMAGPTMSTRFEFHPLGNDNYHFARILVSATESNDTLLIELDADYAEALYDIDVASGPIAHGNLGFAPIILGNFRNRVFTPTQTQTAVNGTSWQPDLAVFPNPTFGEVNIRFSDPEVGIVRTDILDATGRVIRSEVSAPRGEYRMTLPTDGLYILRFTDTEGRSTVSRVVTF